MPARDQRAALDALLAALKPSELALPSAVLERIPPRPPGYGMHRELFPRTTGQSFDAITPAVVAADLVMGELLNPARAARLVTQRALDTTMPGLDTVIDRLRQAVATKNARTPYEAEIVRAMQYMLADHLMSLASTAGMPQVRAVATHTLKAMGRALEQQAQAPGPDAAWQAAAAHLADEIARSLQRPLPPVQRLALPEAPPGAPIGQPALDWLRNGYGLCTAEIRQE